MTIFYRWKSVTRTAKLFEKDWDLQFIGVLFKEWGFGLLRRIKIQTDGENNHENNKS